MLYLRLLHFVYRLFALIATSGCLILAQRCQERLNDIEDFNATGTVLWSDSKFLSLEVATPLDFDYDRSFILDTNTATNLTYGLGRNLTYSINVNQGSGDGDLAYATTLAFGTPPSIDFYTDSNWEGLSACALILDQLPLNTLKRGQKDDGSCTQMFLTACVDAYNKKMAQYALWSTNNPETTGSDNSVTNLTDVSVGEVCDKIASDIGTLPLPSSQGSSLIPDECVPYFKGGPKQDGPAVSAIALTYNTTNGRALGCGLQQWPSVLPNYTINSISRIFHGHKPTSDANYDNATRSIYPIITLFFPQVNVSPNGSWTMASAHMTCPRVTRFANASRVSPALAEPTPVDFQNVLSEGTKAGIGVGTACGVVLVLVAATVYSRRRRAHLRTRAMAAKPPKGKTSGPLAIEVGETERVEADGTVVHQVSRRVMLEGRGNTVQEAPGDDTAQEMPGENTVNCVDERRGSRMGNCGPGRAMEAQTVRSSIIDLAELEG